MAMAALPSGYREPCAWHVAGGCRWRRDGDDFRFEWEPCGVALDLAILREHGDSLTAQLRVRTHPGDRHIRIARLNLWADRTRLSFADGLAKDTPLPRDTYTWRELIEQASAIALEQWTEPKPVIDLSEHTPGERPGEAIMGLFPARQPSAIYSRGGVGKSVLSLAFAASIVTGRPLIRGLDPMIAGPVLYLDWEGDEDEQHLRLRAILAGMGERLEDYRGGFIYHRLDRPLLDESRFVRMQIEKHGIEAVVVDSLTAALHGSINDDDVAREFWNIVLSWRLTSLTIAHVNKAESKQKTSEPKTIMGSMLHEQRPRGTWEVVPSREGFDNGTALALFHRKTNRRFKAPVGLRVRFDGADDIPDAIRFEGYSVDGDATLSGGLPLGKRIWSAIKRYGPMDIDQLAEELDEDVARIGRAVRKHPGIVNANPSKGGKGIKAVWALKTDREPA